MKSSLDHSRVMDVRTALLTVFLAGGLAVYFEPLRRLFALSLDSPAHSYIVAMPFFALFSLMWKRKQIFREMEYSYVIGAITILSSLLLRVWCFLPGWETNVGDYLFLSSLSAAGFITGTLIWFYGIGTFRKALVPVLFLFLMVPLPAVVLDALTAFLQKGSLEAAYWIFKITGIPVSREGVVLLLPQMNLEVAPECSGIRSTTALVVVSMLLGYLYLNRVSGRVILILSSVAISIFKNGLRIVFLYVLSTNVGESILSGPWHTRGGNLFFVVALLLLSPVALRLRALERRAEPTPVRQ